MSSMCCWFPAGLSWSVCMNLWGRTERNFVKSASSLSCSSLWVPKVHPHLEVIKLHYRPKMENFIYKRMEKNFPWTLLLKREDQIKNKNICWVLCLSLNVVTFLTKCLVALRDHHQFWEVQVCSVSPEAFQMKWYILIQQLISFGS